MTENTKNNDTPSASNKIKQWNVEIFNFVFVNLFAFLILMLPVVLITKLLEWLIETQSQSIQILAVLIIALGLAGIIWSYKRRSKSDSLFIRIWKIGPVLPFGVAFSVLFIYISIFSAFVFSMPHQDMFIGESSPRFAQIADFFLWHFCNMIPLIKFNETVAWDVSLTYLSTDGVEMMSGAHRIGYILLLFKVTIVLPIIWMLKGYFTEKNTAKWSKSNSN